MGFGFAENKIAIFKCIALRCLLSWGLGVDLVPGPFWHHAVRGGSKQALQRSIQSCCLNAGNLIMAAVIYSSHGSYLAPADLMGGTEGVRENN